MLCGAKLPILFSFLSYLFTGKVAEVNGEKSEERKVKSEENKKKKPLTRLFLFGGDDETRTHYLYNANVALSQMSYAPVTAKSILHSRGRFVKYFFAFCKAF